MRNFYLDVRAKGKANAATARRRRRRQPEVDIVRVQNTAAAGHDDETVLQWASDNNRVLVTHDVNTLLMQAWRRVEEERPMSGVIAISQSLPITVAIEELVLIIECTSMTEWANQVQYLPL